MCEPRLEQLQVSLDGGGERQSDQVRQVIRADRWSKSLVTETLELIPRRLASVALQGDVPLLSRAAQVVGSEPDTICVRGLLGAEELLALVEPPERVYLAVCNTLGVCHQLSNGFELKHGILSNDEDVKVKPMERSYHLNLDHAPLLT